MHALCVQIIGTLDNQIVTFGTDLPREVILRCHSLSNYNQIEQNVSTSL